MEAFDTLVIDVDERQIVELLKQKMARVIEDVCPRVRALVAELRRGTDAAVGAGQRVGGAS